VKYKTWTKDPEKDYPMKVESYESGYFSLVNLVSYIPKLKKIETNYHETFNYQGVKYLIHNPYELFLKQSATHTTIANSSMVIYIEPLKTNVDEVLEGYEPEKLTKIKFWGSPYSLCVCNQHAISMGSVCNHDFKRMWANPTKF
jgi:hypothetical protein